MSLVDHENAVFWNEPCGSTFAQERGIDVSTKGGITEFDEAYFSFYPYLKSLIDQTVAGAHSVVEVGLGLGATSRYLSSQIEKYVGIDVAKQPCDFVSASFGEFDLTGNFINVSILSTAPNDFEYLFDAAVAIGSLHHTGDLPLSVRKLEALVRPGGKLLVMAYSEFSPRRVLASPGRAAKHMFEAGLGKRKLWVEDDAEARGIHDRNSEGEPPPSTTYVSRGAWSDLFASGSKLNVSRRNQHNIGVPKTQIRVPRKFILQTLGRTLGVDYYVLAKKPRM